MIVLSLDAPVCKSCQQPLIFQAYPLFLKQALEASGGQPAASFDLCLGCFDGAGGWIKYDEKNPATHPRLGELVEIDTDRATYDYGFGVLWADGWKGLRPDTLNFLDDCNVIFWRAIYYHQSASEVL